MEKRVIVIIIASVLLLSLFGGILYYLYEKGVFEKKEENVVNLVTFFLKPLDIKTQQPIDLSYMLFEGQTIQNCLESSSFKEYQLNETLFYEHFPQLKDKIIDEKGCYIKEVIFTKYLSGQMIKGLNEFTINRDGLYSFYFFSNDYYVDKEMWLPLTVSPEQINDYLTSKNDKILLNKNLDDKEVRLIQAYKKENNLKLNLWGDIESNKKSIFRLALEGTDNLRDAGVCFRWTMGVIDINSGYEIMTKPLRYQFMDKCYHVGGNINELSPKLSYDFTIETRQFLQGWDEDLDIVIFDGEYYYGGESWKYGYEDDNGKDVGAIDSQAKIKIYKG